MGNPSFLYWRTVGIRAPRDLTPELFAEMRVAVTGIMDKHIAAVQADLDKATKGGLKVEVRD